MAKEKEMTVGEILQIEAFNASFDQDRSRLERLKVVETAGIPTWEEQTPDEVVVNFSITVDGTVYENAILFARPRNDGSFRWCGDGFIEEAEESDNG